MLKLFLALALFCITEKLTLAGCVSYVSSKMVLDGFVQKDTEAAG